ncbi:MAG: molybdenum cofactor guanylyltransferase MobA [Acetobacteraceae bacterium]|nr:molybdenum cofactor guanylyltransferase MobA [Acetobacteraceae bacterium]
MVAPPTNGAILAGGLARRMGGGDKPLRAIGGATLLAHITGRLRPQVASLVLNANGDSSRFAFCGLPVVADSVGGNAGPLAGILAALEWSAASAPDTQWVVTVPCDTPFLPSDLVDRLHTARIADGAILSIAASGGRVHPVIGLWPVALRRELREAVQESGIRRAGAFVARFRYACADWEGEPDPFLNINTEADLQAADQRLSLR